MSKDLSHDLRLFAEHLGPIDFKALSSGIGLGALKIEAAQRFQAARPPAPRPAAAVTSQTQAAAGVVLNTSLPDASGLTAHSLVPSLQIARSPDAGNKAQHGQGRANARDAQAQPIVRPSGALRPQSQAKKQVAARWPHRLLARSVDLLIVALTFLVTSFTFFYVLEPTSFTWAQSSQWLIARWFKFIGPVEALGALAGGYLAYTLLFRVVAGATLGELCTRLPKRQQQTRAKQ